MALFYVVNFHTSYAFLNDEEEDADIMLGLMLTRYFLYVVSLSLSFFELFLV